MGPTADPAIVLRPGEGEAVFDRPTRAIRILADRDELTLSVFRYGPGEEGPDPHVHRRHTDAFYVLEGELEVALGPGLQPVTAAVGAFAAAPPNVAHTFRNAGDATAVFLNIHAPSTGFGEMLRATRAGRTEEAARFDQFDPPAGGGRPLSDACLRAPSEGRSMAFGTSRAVLKAAGDDADGFFSLAELSLGPGFGPIGGHGHPGAECLYVLDGTLALRLGDHEVEMAPGGFALIPPGSAQTYSSVGEGSVRLLTVMAPGGVEPYLPIG